MKENKYRDIANTMKELRISQGVTQKELANRSGRKQSVISRMESGEKATTMALIYAVAEALGKIPVLSFKDKYEIVEDNEWVKPFRVVATENPAEILYQADTREYCQKFIERTIESYKWVKIKEEEK